LWLVGFAGQALLSAQRHENSARANGASRWGVDIEKSINAIISNMFVF